MLGEMRGGNIRADLDALSSCKLAGFCAFTKLIDKEVLVTLPEKWLREEMKISLNKLTCDSQFELHGTSNPNNLVRIQLPWTQKDINGIFGKVALEYQECMKRYTMGTGGGPGALENFSTWQTRDESYVSQYTQQASNLYLASGTSSLVSPCSKKGLHA
jgi:hypothetical protein